MPPHTSALSGPLDDVPAMSGEAPIVPGIASAASGGVMR